jgi:hypothetical protein
MSSAASSVPVTDDIVESNASTSNTSNTSNTSDIVSDDQMNVVNVVNVDPSKYIVHDKYFMNHENFNLKSDQRQGPLLLKLRTVQNENGELVHYVFGIYAEESYTVSVVKKELIRMIGLNVSTDEMRMMIGSNVMEDAQVLADFADSGLKPNDMGVGPEIWFGFKDANGEFQNQFLEFPPLEPAPLDRVQEIKNKHEEEKKAKANKKTGY